MGRSGLTPGLTSGGRYEHLVLLENEQPRAFTGSPHGRSVEDSDSKALVSSEISEDPQKPFAYVGHIYANI